MTSRSADDYPADIKENCVTRTETNCIRILSGSAGACLRAIHQTGGGSQQQAGSCARSQGELRYRKSWRYPDQRVLAFCGHFHSGGNYGIPVSIIMDAAGFFGATAGMWGEGVFWIRVMLPVSGAVPASDGACINATWNYLGMGPVPIATTEWNLTQSIACGTEPVTGGCMGVNPSGLLPPVEGTAANGNVYLQGELTLTASGVTAGTIGPFPAGR